MKTRLAGQQGIDMRQTGGSAARPGKLQVVQVLTQLALAIFEQPRDGTGLQSRAESVSPLRQRQLEQVCFALEPGLPGIDAAIEGRPLAMRR